MLELNVDTMIQDIHNEFKLKPCIETAAYRSIEERLEAATTLVASAHKFKGINVGHFAATEACSIYNEILMHNASVTAKACSVEAFKRSLAALCECNADGEFEWDVAIGNGYAFSTFKITYRKGGYEVVKLPKHPDAVMPADGESSTVDGIRLIAKVLSNTDQVKIINSAARAHHDLYSSFEEKVTSLCTYIASVICNHPEKITNLDAMLHMRELPIRSFINAEKGADELAIANELDINDFEEIVVGEWRGEGLYIIQDYDMWKLASDVVRLKSKLLPPPSELNNIISDIDAYINA